MQGADGSLYGTTKLGGVRNSACSSGCGTIFKITTSGTLTTLHTFDGTEAGFATSPLLLATDGNFYGTTGYGGGSTACTEGCGTVFQITPSGTFTILHSFGLSDGANPAGGLVQATNGILYGTTVSGGANRVCGGAYCGTVLSLDMGLGKFVETVPTAARTGAKVLILGSDLTGATAVTFNGTPVPPSKSCQRPKSPQTCPLALPPGRYRSYQARRDAFQQCVLSREEVMGG